MNVVTWNTQSFKSNYAWLQSKLTNLDIILLQETWLYDFEQVLIEKEFPNYTCFSVSSMLKSRNGTRGRPYGGTAILIKNLYKGCVVSSDTSDPRLLSVTIKTSNGNLKIVNVYFPCDIPKNDELITKYISLLQCKVEEHDGPILLAGDFNCSEGKYKFNELMQMCNDNDLICDDLKFMDKSTFTFCSKGSGAMSWIDHCFSTENLVQNVTLFDSASPSDHLPLLIKINASCLQLARQKNDVSNSVYVKWKKITSNQIKDYQEKVRNNFLGAPAIICNAGCCSDASHFTMIDSSVEWLVQTLLSCSSSAFSQNHRQKFVEKQIPGWNREIKPRYELYRQAMLLWKTSPQNHDLFTDMNEKRKLFKKELKKCRSEKEKVLSDNLALSYSGNDFKAFWSYVKAEESNGRPEVISEIEGVIGRENVSEYWADYYSKIFNGKQSNKCELEVMQYISKNKERAPLFKIEDIIQAINNLKTGKSPGSEGLCAEHFKHVFALVAPFTCDLINCMIQHCYIPHVIMTVLIKPILKKKGLAQKESKNYRPIAIASMISKLIEILLLKKFLPNLHTCDNQFGYKKNVGTEMAVYVLKQVAHHYLRNDTPVYICFLDCTRGFDLVHHFTLLHKLCLRGFPSSVVKFLLFWFREQMFCVMWEGCKSSPFPVRNSVRQGGILSAYLFALYMDDLSKKLTNTGVGCHVGSQCVNNLIYADDVCLMTSSIAALRILLKICEQYGEQHYIQFNPAKTVCVMFADYQFETTRPLIKFCGRSLVWNDTAKYLGYEISCRNRDHNELMRRRREIYARANLLTSRFSKCSASVKVYLFKTFFSSLYCSSLWVPVQKKMIDNVRVAYNDACRMLFGYSRRSSASRMFCDLGLDSFDAMRRRAAYSLLSRLAASDNTIIKSIINSNFFLMSSTSREWRALLFN